MENERLNEKYFVITAKNDRQKNKNLRRYLNNHDYHVQTIEYANDAFKFLIKDIIGIQEDDFEELGIRCPKVEEENLDYEPSSVEILPTSQDLLMHWARETFPEGSEERKLICGGLDEENLLPDDDKSTDGIEEKVEDVNFHTPKARLDSTMSDETVCMESCNDINNNGDSPEEVVVEERDIQQLDYWKMFENTYDNKPKTEEYTSSEDEDTPVKSGKRKKVYKTNGDCQICSEKVPVGRTRKSELRGQTNHIVRSHQNEAIANLLLSKRYRCEGCCRVLSLFQTPCEHLSNHHLIDERETEFRDLWTTAEVNAFNELLTQAFSRKLPIPRSRRIKATDASTSQKANYKIKDCEGKFVEEIKTIEEKDHTSKEQEPSASKSNNPLNNFYMMDEEDDKQEDQSIEFGYRSSSSDEMADRAMEYRFEVRPTRPDYQEAMELMDGVFSDSD